MAANDNFSFDELSLATLIRELQEDFSVRDAYLDFWDALIYREAKYSEFGHTGQYVPPPFDKSKTIIKHATGIIADRAEFIAKKAAENKPNIVAFHTANGDDPPTARQLKENRKLELALNSIYWEADRRSSHTLQQQISWSQTTKGVGWYHTYRARDGWLVPSRRFFRDPSDEEIERLRAEGTELVEAFEGGPEGMTHAEDLTVTRRRQAEARKQNAIDGAQLYIVETLSPRKVYYRKDTDGRPIIAIIEEVPKSAIGEEWGEIVEHGETVAGRELPKGDSSLRQHRGTYQLARVWTRTEYYYYVAKGTGSQFAGTGRIVAQGHHNFGEPPFWPAFATQTDSDAPEREFLPAIYGALAIVPGYNQILTLLSNAAVFNTTPRYVIIKQDGAPIVDPETGDLITFESDTTVGLDPQYAAIINAGQGKFEQLEIKNIDHLIKVWDAYQLALDTTLPSEASRGESGSSEPAWGTRLKQAAQNIKIGPLVDNHAAAVEGMERAHARDLRIAGHRIYLKSMPHRRGTAARVRGLVELDPEIIHTDIGVRQENRDLQERIQLMQVGTELLTANRIDPIRYYEHYQGEDDPYGALRDATAWILFQQMWPHVMNRIIERIQGRLFERTPNEMQTEAELAAGQIAVPGPGEPAEAAGVRGPGMEMGVTQNALPPLQGQGATALQGNRPV